MSHDLLALAGYTDDVLADLVDHGGDYRLGWGGFVG